MRQVPEKNNKYSYLIVGNGKLSVHFQQYFNLKEISFTVWSRNSSHSFESQASKSTGILVLINDDAIVPFIRNHKKGKLAEKQWIHCSGLLSTPLADSAHPLMTFTEKLYDLNFYESVVFITEKNRKSFIEIFPDLSNRSYEIDSKEKALYHAMCVISGNLTSFLWKIFFDYLEEKQIPAEAAHEYLRAITENLILSKDPVTGPFQRNDPKVIAEHKNALKGHQIEEIYTAFESSFRKVTRENTVEID